MVVRTTSVGNGNGNGKRTPRTSPQSLDYIYELSAPCRSRA